MVHTELIPVSDGFFDSWQRCVQDFDGSAMDGSGSWMVEGFAADRASFQALAAVAEADRYRQHTTASGSVPCSWFWIGNGDVDDPITGFVALRHTLDNEFLARVGGHIGYSVRPSRRRRGHAAAALALALDKARELGLDRVLVTCREDNAASAAVIEGGGGVFESSAQGHRRYWITL